MYKLSFINQTSTTREFYDMTLPHVGMCARELPVCSETRIECYQMLCVAYFALFNINI